MSAYDHAMREDAEDDRAMSAFDHSLYAMREDAEDDLYKDGLELIFDDRTLTSSSPSSEELELASDDFFRGIGASPTSDEFFLGLVDDEGMIYEEDEEDEEKKEAIALDSMASPCGVDVAWALT